MKRDKQPESEIVRLIPNSRQIAHAKSPQENYYKCPLMPANARTEQRATCSRSISLRVILGNDWSHYTWRFIHFQEILDVLYLGWADTYRSLFRWRSKASACARAGVLPGVLVTLTSLFPPERISLETETITSSRSASVTSVFSHCWISAGCLPSRQRWNETPRAVSLMSPATPFVKGSSSQGITSSMAERDLHQ